MPFPMLKNSGQVIRFPLFDGAGGFLTGASPTVKVSVDDGTFATSTNSASEIATASGIYKLTLTAAETNGDVIQLRITSTSPSPIYREFYTEVRQIKDLTFPNVTGRGLDVSAGGDADAVVQSIAAGAITAASLNADVDTYQATVKLTDDNGGTTDRYTVVWYKNSAPVTSGITSPTIQVWKAADGVDLVASTAMTQIASTGTYRYNEATNRVVDGVAYIAKVTASIDSATRSWEVGVSRDS